MKLVRLPSLWDPGLSALAWSAALAGALALPSTAWGLGQAPEAPPPDAPSATPNSSEPAAQDPAPQATLLAAAPAVAPSAAPEPTPAPPDHAQSPSEDAGKGAITEEELKTLVAGKTLYLREGYLENTLSFDEHGGLWRSKRCA
jgi:hypothetical protein